MANIIIQVLANLPPSCIPKVCIQLNSHSEHVFSLDEFVNNSACDGTQYSFTDPEGDYLLKIKINDAPQYGSFMLYDGSSWNIVTSFPVEVTASQLQSGYFKFIDDSDESDGYTLTLSYEAADTGSGQYTSTECS